MIRTSTRFAPDVVEVDVSHRHSSRGELSAIESTIVTGTRQGLTIAAIAAALGVTRQAVQHRLRSPRIVAALAGEPLPPAPRIGRPPKPR